MSKKFSKAQMDEMEEMISAFLKKNQMALSVPVDIFALATDLGFDVRAAALPKRIEGLILVDESAEKIEGFNSNKVIAYNILLDIDEKKFIVAHELAHYIEEKCSHGDESGKIVIAARDHEPGYSTNVDEQRKDYIAAALLIPRDDLNSKYTQRAQSKDENFYRELADHYRVDNRLAERRIEEVFYGQQTAE